MPTYEYKCPEGHIITALTTIARRHEPQTCTCGMSADFVISAPTIPMSIDSDRWAKMHEKAGQGDDPVNLVHV